MKKHTQQTRSGVACNAIDRNRQIGVQTIVATLVLAAIFTFSCSSDDGDDSNYEMLNGVWDRGYIVVTFKGSNAVFTEIKSNSAWQTVLNNGLISIGDQKFKNITGSNLEWACQGLTYDTVSYTVSNWKNCTISMSSDGQTITVVTPEIINPTTVYTKVQ